MVENFQVYESAELPSHHQLSVIFRYICLFRDDLEKSKSFNVISIKWGSSEMLPKNKYPRYGKFTEDNSGNNSEVTKSKVTVLLLYQNQTHYTSF